MFLFFSIREDLLSVEFIDLPDVTKYYCIFTSQILRNVPMCYLLHVPLHGKTNH